MINRDTRILGIDLGTKRIGLAIADWQVKIAAGLGVIEYKNRNLLIRNLHSIVKENDIGLLVVGLPKNMDGSEGTKAQEARKIGDLINKSLAVEIAYEDETLTTFQAIRDLQAGGGKVGKSRKNINMMAAILILQDFLDKQSSS